MQIVAADHEYQWCMFKAMYINSDRLRQDPDGFLTI